MWSAHMPGVQELLVEASGLLGTPIQVIEDASLSVAGRTSVIKLRPNYGKILVSPRYADCANYVVANQLRHILRYARAPPESRSLPSESPSAYSFIHREVEQHVRGHDLLRRLPPHAVDELTRQLKSGLTTQLTSMPVDCRIDRWLYEDVAELRDEQHRGLTKTLDENAQALKAAAWTPRLIYRASNGMNAAYAANAADLFPDFEPYARRYDREGFGELMGRLVAHLDGEDKGHVSDVRTVDAWAMELGVRELYRWANASRLPRRND